MDVNIARAILVLSLAVLGAHEACAAEVTRYFTSSASQRPRSNAGVSLTGDRVRLKADVAMRAPGNETRIVPNLSSAFTITDKVGLETRVDLAEWNSRTDLLEAKIDTRLHFQSPAPFLDELEGRIWRTPDGRSGRILKFGFYQILRQADVGPNITLNSLATVENTVGGWQPGIPAGASGDARLFRPENQRFRFETELRGLKPSWLPGKAALRLKLEETVGASPERARSLAYDHSWRFRGYADVGVNLGMLHATRSAETLSEPSFGFTWRAEF